MRAELVLLYAFETPQTLSADSQSIPSDPAISERLQALAASSKVPVIPVLHAGPAGEVICWVAQQRECDLIVLGTHGRTGLVHLLLGSVSEHVMRHARCPVLTVRQRPVNEPPLGEPLVMPLKAPPFM
jgi:nucleotide-binding universal stress UspA family protein